MFELWMLYLIFAIVAILVEIYVPTLFCINFAFAGIITSVFSVFYNDFYATMSVFIALSLVSFVFIKPMLVKYFKNGANADFQEQYIGKIVKVIETVTCSSGAVTIYDERWDARIKKEGESIDVGCEVKIIANDSLILYVERI